MFQKKQQKAKKLEARRLSDTELEGIVGGQVTNINQSLLLFKTSEMVSF